MSSKAGTGRKVLAVASAGGHWVQLQRLRLAFEGHNVTYLTTNADYREEVSSEKFYAVNDASARERIGLVRMAFRVLIVVIRERPDVVLTTGAACGYFAVLFGKVLGARTVWVDSIANIEQISLAGRWARRYADLWLTQWPHLASANGPHFAGAVL